MPERSQEGVDEGRQRSRPNFLIFMTDQQRADHLGCMGDSLLRTPHIDALADAGVVMDRFYANAPVCMPNRAALVTGRMPGAAGVRMNGVPLPLTAITYADALHDAGYRTALIGKAHFQNMTRAAPTPMPGEPQVPRSRQGTRDMRTGAGYSHELPDCSRSAVTGAANHYYGFEHTELCLEHGDQVEGDYSAWLLARSPELAQQRWQSPDNSEAAWGAPQAWRSVLPEELYPSSFVADRTEAWLRNHALTPPDQRQPFLLHCSFPDPHHPFTPPGLFAEMYAPHDVTLPRSFDASMELAPPHKQALHAELRSGQRMTRGSRVIAVSADEARQAIALNYGAISMIDKSVGRVMATLRALDLAQDTVVVFLSDHGDYMGDHGLLFKGPLHYQSVLRMPFIWHDPQAARFGSKRCNALASAIDLAPTLLERAGVLPWHGIQGRSLLPLFAQRDSASVCQERRSVLVEEHCHRAVPGLPMPARVRSLVTDRWRLSIYPGANWGELYDLQQDPCEIQNLFAAPPALETRAELLWQMSRQMAALAPDLPLADRMA